MCKFRYFYVIIKKIKIQIFVSFVFLSCFDSAKYNQENFDCEFTDTIRCAQNYRNKLICRIKQSEYQYKYKIPPVSFSPEITANAVFRNDTIFVGRSFFSNHWLKNEDRLSVIFHEYNHFLNQLNDTFPIRTDSLGRVFQISTEILYEKPVFELEIEKDKKALLEKDFDEKTKDLISNQINKPALLRFRYAPSNLSRDELLCYQEELKADEIYNLFHLSNDYKKFVEYRIELEKMYLKMRINYEKNHNLTNQGYHK